MNSLQTRVCLLTLTLGLCAAANAQETVPIEYYRPLRNSFSVGVRVIGGEAKVNFGALGNIRQRTFTTGTESGARIYDNGFVNPDSKRVAEVNNTPATTPTSYFVTISDQSNTEADTRTIQTQRRVDVGGGRYQIFDLVSVSKVSDGSAISSEERLVGDYLSFQDGFTRGWAYASSAVQTNPALGTLDLSNYSVSPGTSTAQAESDRSSGVELQFAHVIKRYKRFEWGFNFSAGASEINAKTSKVIRANLRADTDRYALRAGSAFKTYDFYSAGADVDVRQVATTVTGSAVSRQVDSEYENEHYLSRTATRFEQNREVDVYGYWQIKGAYYLFRAGPVVRFPFAKKWAATISAGGALAYIGTNFITDEYILLPDLEAPFQTREVAEEKRAMPGYYADVNIERWLTVRTGFFAGFAYEKVASYDQTLRGRTAKVDIGGGGGFRFGVITRF